MVEIHSLRTEVAEMRHSLRWQPCIDDAEDMIQKSKDQGHAVLLDAMVKELLARHPNSGLSPREMGVVVRTLVIEQRWSVAP